MSIPPTIPPTSRRLAILGLLATAGLTGLTFRLGGIALALAWLLGIGLGFTTQRFRFCFVSAFRDLVMFGTTSTTRASFF